MNDSPKVFISYSLSKKDFVKKLVCDLSCEGVEVIFDQWDLRPGHDIIVFMEKIVNDPTLKKVLIISDKTYADKANCREDGVGTEVQIITSEIYNDPIQSKYALVSTEKDDDGKHCIPTFYKSRKYIDMTDNKNYKVKLTEIVHWIHDCKTPIVLGIDNAREQVVKAIKDNQSRDKIYTCLEQYLEALVENLKKIRPKENDYGPLDYNSFKKNIESFVRERNGFINLVDEICRSELGIGFSQRLHDFFKKALHVYYLMLVKCAKQTDDYQFIIHELYLYSVATYLKYKQFDECLALFKSYKFDNRKEYSFAYMSNSIRALDKGEGLSDYKRTAARGELLKMRCDKALLTLEELCQADLVCLIRAVVDNGKKTSAHGDSLKICCYDDMSKLDDDGRSETEIALAQQNGPTNFLWIPFILTVWDGGSALDIFDKASDPGYFSRIKDLVGVSTGIDLKNRIIELENLNGGQRRTLIRTIL